LFGSPTGAMIAGRSGQQSRRKKGVAFFFRLAIFEPDEMKSAASIGLEVVKGLFVGFAICGEGWTRLPGLPTVRGEG
jgi:hypothetical protein